MSHVTDILFSILQSAGILFLIVVVVFAILKATAIVFRMLTEDFK